jgi:FAD/FMN-containing dehydrogenase
MEPRSNSDRARASGGSAQHAKPKAMTAPTRRAFLAGAGAATAGALAWSPVFRATPASADPATRAIAAQPPNFPSSIDVYQQAYQNWSGMIVIDDVWTCAPASPADVVTLANWAHANGYRLRAKGMSHGWSPTLLPSGSTGAGYVLLDTTQHLTSVSISSGTVTAQAGVTMDTLTTALAASGHGLAAVPAPGDITLGGALAINAHGTAIPADGETPLSGQTYGSLSNLILELTAVVWDSGTSAYVLQTFQRSDPDIRAFLVHLGRAFVTQVTMQVAASQNIQCQSWFDVSMADLCAAPASAGSSSVASYISGAGRIEMIWFPFTANPWLKVWKIAADQPFLSKEVSSPYNYTFADSVTSAENTFFGDVVDGITSGTPAYEETALSLTGAGLIATDTWDIWGKWQNVLLYVKPTTARIVDGGWAVITSRANIQQVVSDFYAQYESLLTSFSGNGQYPMNGPVEIRITGLDDPSLVTTSGAQSPILSSIRPRPDQPDWDVAVWLNMGTLPVTPGFSQFYTEMESWIWGHYTGSYATVRPEWSKAWACTSTAPWTNTSILASTIPAAVSAGQASDDGWSEAIAILTTYDPDKVFSSPFLDTLFG